MKNNKNKSVQVLTTTLLVLLSMYSEVHATESLPFMADDLNQNERWASNHQGTQKGNYLLVVKRHINETNSWTTLKINGDPLKNTDHLAYGKPVYAMTDGLVTHCWRNAPENPRPRQASDDSKSQVWLHPAIKSKQIPAGGNELWIKNKDGSRYHYAHMTRGSIPKHLCPNENALFNQTGVSETAIPMNKQTWVKKGQFLGMVGNSGNSPTTQLSISKHVNSQRSRLIFASGLASTNNDINKWYSFAGKSIPEGSVLIWPPRQLRAEYTRHQISEEKFKSLFLHLADSGYAPEWIDGYSVDGKAYYNFIWRPSKTQWRAYFGKTIQQYQQLIKSARNDGYSASQIESYLSGNQIHYAVIFKKLSEAWHEEHQLNAEQHQVALFKAIDNGFSPVNISVVSKDSQRLFTVLYKKNLTNNWLIETGLDATEYQNIVNLNHESGVKPIYINSYMHEGKPLFAVIFAKILDGNWRVLHDLDNVTLPSAWKNSTGRGMLTRMVSGYDGDLGDHRFTALWRQ